MWVPAAGLVLGVLGVSDGLHTAIERVRSVLEQARLRKEILVTAAGPRGVALGQHGVAIEDVVVVHLVVADLVDGARKEVAELAVEHV